MLPQTHRALILDQVGQPLRVDPAYPTPAPTPGSAVVKILTAGILSYSREIYNGQRKYTLPTPSVPGNGAIGRIAALGPDASTLQEGDLVLVDIYFRARDNEYVGALSGVHDGHDNHAKRMMHGAWKDSTFAEYARLPLENLFKLDEQKLLGAPSQGLGGGFGYSVEELLLFVMSLVPFGGLRDVGLDVAETVLISPATGMFGGAAVHVALAMGANVIAMGRNVDLLEKLKTDLARCGRHIHTVPMVNDVEKDMAAIKKLGLTIDVFFDISPPEASASTHIKTGILSLRKGGRVSLMGGLRTDMPLPIGAFMHRNLTLKGKWMYEREDVQRIIKMVESGRLKLGQDVGSRVVGKYGLEQWKEALDVAAEQSGPGLITAFVP